MCGSMSLGQIAVISIFIYLKIYFIAFAILILLCIQLVAMSEMLKDPKKLVPWYNAPGVLLYVTGMMITAMGLMRGF